MRWTVCYNLRCDYLTADGQPHNDCEDSTEAHFSKREVLNWARESGWLVLTRKAYCPNCRRLVRGGTKATEE